MDDDTRHRFEEDHTIRNVIYVAVVTALVIFLFEYINFSKPVLYGLLGFVSGSATGFLVGYLIKR